mmetsp:Transcript_63324/g.100600  ORF Transcript_63324/g.100600 Transcript_63324/m.100600 type:complete len:126 (-) Transcript_63324:244-621(-)
MLYFLQHAIILSVALSIFFVLVVFVVSWAKPGDNARRDAKEGRKVMEAISEVKMVNEEICGICLESMAVGALAGQLRCQHLFHSDCLLEWWKTSRDRAPVQSLSCPLCRTEFNVLGSLTAELDGP